MALGRVRPVQQFVFVSCLFVTRATRCGRRMLASICAGWAVVALPAPASAASAEEQLAEKYAPVVRLVEQEEDCGEGEPYEPIDVDLVLVNATVTDSLNRYVSGLGQEHFQIWEDKIEQKITYFSAEDVAISIGVIFDVSGSMKDKITTARDDDRQAIRSRIRLG